MSLAELQEKVREYVTTLQTVQKQRQTVKMLNANLKSLGQEITQMLLDQEVTSCAAMGYTFLVKEKAKMKSMTANVVVEMIRQHFQIPPQDMQTFRQSIDLTRRQNCEYVHTLECKPTKASSQTPEPMTVHHDDPPDSSRMSSVMDDLYES